MFINLFNFLQVGHSKDDTIHLAHQVHKVHNLNLFLLLLPKWEQGTHCQLQGFPWIFLLKMPGKKKKVPKNIIPKCFFLKNADESTMVVQSLKKLPRKQIQVSVVS